MERQELKCLIALSRRATDNHVIGYGSANIVIKVAEFHALEQAIEELKKRKSKRG